MAPLAESLRQLLQALRFRRGFDAQRWVDAKAQLLNAYFARSGLSGCVVGVSGGVDSALTLALCAHAAKQPGAALRRVVPALLPMFVREGATNQDVATGRGREVAAVFGLAPAVVDLSQSLDAMRAAVERGLGQPGSAWAAGQLVSYHRTPALYYLATLLTDGGHPSVVIGTTNRDEGAFIGFFGKASDGMVDLQLISDAHKSEVYAASRLLGVPQAVLGAVPSGDTFDGRVDEEMIGAPYDFVELHALCRTLLEPGELDRLRADWSTDARAQFDRLVEAVDGLHRKNAHKYVGQSPAVHLDVWPREVPALEPRTSPVVPPDPSGFVGLFSAPDGLAGRLRDATPPPADVRSIADCGESALLINGALSPSECAELVQLVGRQNRVPTGLDGRTGSFDAARPPGSLRASMFDHAFAAALWRRLERHLPRARVMADDTPTDWNPERVWRAVGLSPLLRFIWYEPGGLLVPHYDASYDEGGERRTLMSVLFFLTAPGGGGSTRLLLERQRHLPLSERSFDDGTEPAQERDVLASVAPEPGAALVFDHRMPHDGQPWRGPGPRVLLRTDVVFERCGGPGPRPMKAAADVALWRLFGLDGQYQRGQLNAAARKALEAAASDAQRRELTWAFKLLRDRHYTGAYAALGSRDAVEEAGFFEDASPPGTVDARRDSGWLVTPLHKVTARLQKLEPNSTQPLAVLVSTGGFSPIHRGHIEMMELARGDLEAKGFAVLGGYISPSHDAYVLPKCNFQVPVAAHRIRLCERAVETSDWLMVDPWEAMHTDVAVNFTDVVQRLEEYLSRHVVTHRPIEVVYVFGSDNARFALTFVERGRAVCVTRPGYEAQIQKYAGHPLVKGNSRLHMLTAQKSARASSREIRDGSEAPLSEELRPLWRSWRQGPPDRATYAVLYVRDEGDWAVEPWFQGRPPGLVRDARDWFQRRLLELLERVFARAQPPDVPCQIQLEVRRLDEQRTAAAAMLRDQRFISLDPCLGGTLNLGLSRSFELAADVSRGTVARPGWPPLEEQLARIAPGEYVLVDDDRASGRTLSEALRMLSQRCTVSRTVLLCDPGAEPRPAGNGPAFVDLVDFRDFLAGARDSGLVLSLPDGALSRPLCTALRAPLEPHLHPALQREVVLGGGVAAELRVLRAGGSTGSARRGLLAVPYPGRPGRVQRSGHNDGRGMPLASGQPRRIDMSDERRIAALLERLSCSLAGRTAFELDNLHSDLGAVSQRLDSGEYREADFLVRNVFDVQRRTREYLTYFAGWNAQATEWARLLDAAGARHVDHIVDLCPGWAPKIELALFKLGFAGRVRLVDKNPEAMAALIRFVEAFAPRFALEAVEADVFDAPSAPGALVVANHLLDDVVLDRWAARLGVDRGLLYEDEHALAQTWQRLIERSAEVTAELPPVAAAGMAAHVAVGGRLIVTHYASHAERLLGAAAVSQLFDRLFVDLGRALEERGLKPLRLDPGVFPRGQVAAFERP